MTSGTIFYYIYFFHKCFGEIEGEINQIFLFYKFEKICTIHFPLYSAAAQPRLALVARLQANKSRLTIIIHCIVALLHLLHDQQYSTKWRRQQLQKTTKNDAILCKHKRRARYSRQKQRFIILTVADKEEKMRTQSLEQYLNRKIILILRKCVFLIKG